MRGFIKVVFQLIRKSNTTPFEWLQSPIVYRENELFRKELWELCGQYYSQRSNIHHYLGIAKGAMGAFLPGNQIGIKKLFYILRPLLAARWCYEKNSISPMTIGLLLGLLPAPLQKEVRTLIMQKEVLPESCPIAISDAMREYIENCFSLISEASSALPRNEFSAERLDDFFIKSITP